MVKGKTLCGYTRVWVGSVLVRDVLRCVMLHEEWCGVREVKSVRLKGNRTGCAHRAKQQPGHGARPVIPQMRNIFGGIP